MTARAAAIALALAALPLAACTEVESSAVEGYQPSKLTAVKGTDVHRVTFTAEGAERTDLQTAPITRRGSRSVAPYRALIYDGEGATWVYRTDGRLSFMREAVVVQSIADDEVLLREGPPPGTDVVTVGAAEVYGTELEIAGGH
jgi:hypothetical protein